MKLIINNKTQKDNSEILYHISEIIREGKENDCYSSGLFSDGIRIKSQKNKASYSFTATHRPDLLTKHIENERE